MLAGTCMQRLSSNAITSVVPGHEPQSFTFDHVANAGTTQNEMFQCRPLPAYQIMRPVAAALRACAAV